MKFLRSLFAPRTNPAGPLYERLVAEARSKHWYLAGGIPDTIDGRFAVLATLVARTIVRLEEDGEDGIHDSAALTERFVTDMDAQIRQAGFDTTLSKKVRKLVSAMGARSEAWREADRDNGDAVAAVAASALCVDGEPPSEAAIELLRLADSQIGNASRAHLMTGDWS